MRLDDHPNGGSDPDFVQSLARGLAVITAFSSERSAMTLTEVAQATGLTRAAARRFLLTLHRLGYVYMNDREFSLTPRTLIRMCCGCQPVRFVAQPESSRAAKNA